MMSLAEGFFDVDYGAFHHTFEVQQNMFYCTSAFYMGHTLVMSKLLLDSL